MQTHDLLVVQVDTVDSSSFPCQQEGFSRCLFISFLGCVCRRIESLVWFDSSVNTMFVIGLSGYSEKNIIIMDLLYVVKNTKFISICDHSN